MDDDSECTALLQQREALLVTRQIRVEGLGFRV